MSCSFANIPFILFYVIKVYVTRLVIVPRERKREGEIMKIEKERIRGKPLTESMVADNLSLKRQTEINGRNNYP